jgi:hypothetical protein
MHIILSFFISGEANKVAKEAANRWTGKWDSDYSKGSAVAYKPVSSHEL